MGTILLSSLWYVLLLEDLFHLVVALSLWSLARIWSSLATQRVHVFIRKRSKRRSSLETVAIGKRRRTAFSRFYTECVVAVYTMALTVPSLLVCDTWNCTNTETPISRRLESVCLLLADRRQIFINNLIHRDRYCSDINSR